MVKTALRTFCHIFLGAIPLLCLVGTCSAIAQGDGPRAYQLVPDNTQSVSQFYFLLSGDNTPSEGLIIEGADIQINLGVTQYATSFDMGGHQAGLMAIVPYGNVSGSLSSGFGVRTGGDSGLGDVIVGFAYGIVGAPVLTREEYVKYDPGLAIAALAQLSMPTGSYDSDRILNMGGNRWALSLGLPTMYYLGTSFFDPKLTSFELLPKVTFFSENTDAPGSTHTLAQNPLYSLEGHITRNIGQVFWVSLDALYEFGGETISDGKSDNNKQNSLSLGVTGAMNFSVNDAAMSLKVSYGEVVAGSPSSSNERMFRLQFLALF